VPVGCSETTEARANKSSVDGGRSYTPFQVGVTSVYDGNTGAHSVGVTGSGLASLQRCARDGGSNQEGKSRDFEGREHVAEVSKEAQERMKKRELWLRLLYPEVDRRIPQKGSYSPRDKRGMLGLAKCRSHRRTRKTFQ